MLESYNDFQKNYEGESDRSVAILASSFIEEALGKNIRLKLVDAPEVSRLFEGYAPLATFAAKIDMSLALGLIPTHTHEDLRTIKRLRNIFAHKPDAVNFETSQIKDICERFHSVKRSDGTAWEITGGRAKYLNAAWFCLLHMEAEAGRTTRLSLAKFRFEEVVESRRAD
jgi:hypothetical protein